MLNAGSSVKPVSRVVSVMPSCALERWVEVILSARMTGPSMRLTALLAGFELGAVEVDERELARDEEAGADDQDDADGEEDPLDHRRSPPVADTGTGLWEGSEAG